MAMRASTCRFNVYVCVPTNDVVSQTNKLRSLTQKCRSNPLRKSAKKNHTAQPLLSRAFKAKCRMYTMACCVDFPAIANCLLSS